MPPIIMRRGLIDLSTRTPLSIARLSASAPSSHDLSLAAFTINIAESNFRQTQGSTWQFRADLRFGHCFPDRGAGTKRACEIPLLGFSIVAPWASKTRPPDPPG